MEAGQESVDGSVLGLSTKALLRINKKDFKGWLGMRQWKDLNYNVLGEY